MPFDIRLPDGRILRNIPDGTTKAQIVAKLGYDPSARQEPAFDVTAGSAPLDPRAPVDQGLLPMANAPTIAGVPVTAMEGPGASMPMQPSLADRWNASGPERLAKGVETGALGIAQVVSALANDVAGQFGYEIPIAREAQDLATRGINENAAETRRAMEIVASEQERNASRVGVETSELGKSWNRADALGLVGQVLPFAVATPAVGVGATGLTAALGRTAYAGATGGVAGYFMPQEGEVSLDQAEQNAIIGMVAGAVTGGVIEFGMSTREMIQRLGKHRASQVILDSVDPNKVAAVIDELRNSRPAIPGYQPTAQQAAVAADQPRFAALGESSQRFAPGQALAQADAQQLAQADQLARVSAAQVAGDVPTVGTATPTPAPAIPVDDVTSVAAREAQEAGFRQSSAASGRQAIAATQADQLAAVTEQQEARLRQSAQELAEAEARAAASREAGLAAVGPQMDESVGQAKTAIAKAKEALEEEARAIPLGMANVEGTRVGEALSAAARAEKLRVDTEIINPAYARAFEAAGETPAAIAANSVPKAALPETAAAVRFVLGSNTAALSSETAPQTLKAMAVFGLTPEQAAARAAGEAVPTGQATLRQINDARVAINADYARAKSIPDATIRGQTLDHLTRIKAALDADLAASTTIAQEAKDLYGDAIQLWRQNSLPRFRTGDVSTKLFQTTIRNTPAIRPSGVAPAFLNNEDSAREFVRLYTSADGTVNQEAAAAMRDGVEDAFRGTVSRRTGIDVTSADTWLRKHDKQLDVLEEAMPGLRARLEGYVDAQRRVTMTGKELDATLKSIPREAQAEAKAAAQAIEDAAKQETTLARVAREQRDAAIRADADSASASVRARASERMNVLSVRERRLKAEADEAKRIAALLTFKSEDDMAAKVLSNQEVRQQIIQRSGRNARMALAQRAEWDARNAGNATKQMAFINDNEQALMDVFRAADPQTAPARLQALRQEAQEAAAREASQAAGRGQKAVMDARMGAARRATEGAPVEGESRKAYLEARDRLTQGFTPEQMRSLEALELDIARQQRVIEQAKNTKGGSDIEVATRVAGSHGIPDLAGRLWAITKHILNLSQRSLSEAQAKQVAQLMLDPNMTADALEAAVRLRATNQAARGTAATVGRAGAAAAAQSGANQ